LLRAAPLLCLLAAASACAKVQAKTPAPLPPPPPLETPAPDPRLIIPVPVEPDVPPPAPAAATAPAPTRRDPSTAKPPPPAPPTTPPPASPPEPPPVLQATPSMSQVETEARNLLASANHLMNRVQVWTLDDQGMANWKHVRNLIAAANRALDSKSFDYARQVAGKAARLAALLVKASPAPSDETPSRDSGLERS
jgi:hypothetical protein